jgi:hypothetical protein
MYWKPTNYWIINETERILHKIGDGLIKNGARSSWLVRRASRERPSLPASHNEETRGGTSLSNTHRVEVYKGVFSVRARLKPAYQTAHLCFPVFLGWARIKHRKTGLYLSTKARP